MIVVKRLVRFELQATGAWKTLPVRVDFAPMIGYLPVYANLEDARKDFPDTPVLGIEFVAEPPL